MPVRSPLSIFVLTTTLLGCGAHGGAADMVEMRGGGSSAPGPTTLGPAARPTQLELGKFGFVEKVGDRRVLLVATDVDAAWGQGKAELVSQPDDPMRIARVPIAPGAVPESHRISGQELELYDGTAIVGRATLGAMWIASFAFGTFEPLQPGEVRPSNDELAELTAKDGKRWLVVELGPDAPASAQWGRLAAFPEPVMPEMRPADAATTAQASAMVEKEDLFTEAQERFESHFASVNQPKPADRWQDTGTASVITFSHRGETYVYARYEAGEPCWFNAVIARLYVRRGASLTQVSGFETTDEPLMLIDTDADGELEMITTPTFGTGARALSSFYGWRVRLSDERPDNGCPC